MTSNTIFVSQRNNHYSTYKYKIHFGKAYAYAWNTIKGENHY